jgi:addiction module RelB/DinJ family antitoxin
MNTAVINIKVQPDIKKRAQIVASELGFSLSALINAYLKQLVKTKTVIFSASSEEPTEYLLEALRESREDITKGRVSPVFTNADDAVAWLKNPKKKYADKIR